MRQLRPTLEPNTSNTHCQSVGEVEVVGEGKWQMTASYGKVLYHASTTISTFNLRLQEFKFRKHICVDAFQYM